MSGRFTDDEVKAWRVKHGIVDSANNNTTSDHPMVEALRELMSSAELLADDKNQAFTQLYLGKFQNLFTDETKDFAMAYTFALHPLDDIQEELELMGITEPQIIRKSAMGKDGKEIIVSEAVETPVKFEIDILRNFIDEWLRKRVPANRARVKEFIKIMTGQEDKVDSYTQNVQQYNPETRTRLV